MISILVSGALLPVLLGAWLVAAIFIWAFAGSNTLGGPAEGGEWWSGWAMIVLLVFAVAVDVVVGVRLYRRRTRQIGRRG
jgi:hypothetical protein